MNTTTEQATLDRADKPRAVAKKPEKPIEGFVYIQGGQSLHEKQKGDKSQSKAGVARYIHGLVVPGMGVGTKRGTKEKMDVPRNRMLLPDRDCAQWFKDLLAEPVLPQEFENVGIRCSVKALLNNNVAFILPQPRSREQALMEWSTHELDLRNNVIGQMNVHDQRSLCSVFYSRAVKMHDGIILARILPETMTALAVRKNGYFYELSGAERLVRHIGRAGTNGMILDRDIDTVFRFNQIFDMVKVETMFSDPTGFSL